MKESFEEKIKRLWRERDYDTLLRSVRRKYPKSEDRPVIVAMLYDVSWTRRFGVDSIFYKEG